MRLRLHWDRRIRGVRAAATRTALTALLLLLVVVALAAPRLTADASASRSRTVDAQHVYNAPAAATTSNASTRTDAEIADASPAGEQQALTSAGRSSASARVADLLAAEDGVRLFLAVGPDEAADIAATGSYRIVGKSAEFGKYFYPTEAPARAFVGKGWATDVTSSVFPRTAVDAERIRPGTEGPALFLPSDLFPHSPVGFHG